MRSDSISSIISSIDNLGVHNFSLGCLCCYFYLNENMNRGKIKVIEDGGAFFLPYPKPKTFVFSYKEEYKQEILKYQKLGPVYSINRIPLRLEKEFKEVEYDLDAVFNDTSYPNTDKRKKAIRAPFKKLKDWGVTSEDLSEKNIEQVKDVHEKWVEYKLNLPGTFRMMFSTARYFRCCKLCIEPPKKVGLFGKSFEVQPRYLGRLYRIDGKPASVFVSSIQETTAYSLAGFSLSWDVPSQFTHHTMIDFMKWLYSLGITTVNDGSSLNKGLSTFKHHYPYKTKISYMYSQEK